MTGCTEGAKCESRAGVDQGFRRADFRYQDLYLWNYEFLGGDFRVLSYCVHARPRPGARAATTRAIMHAGAVGRRLPTGAQNARKRATAPLLMV